MKPNPLHEPGLGQRFNPAPRCQRTQPTPGLHLRQLLKVGFAAAWGRRSLAPPGPFRFRAPGSSAAIAAGRPAARRAPSTARRESVAAPVTGATAAPPPRLLDRLSAPFSNCPSAGAGVWGGRSLGGRQVPGRCGRRRRERRRELRVSVIPGAVGPARSAAPSLPRAVPTGRVLRGGRPRGRGRKWGRAGRGDSSLALLPTALPFSARP